MACLLTLKELDLREVASNLGLGMDATAIKAGLKQSGVLFEEGQENGNLFLHIGAVTVLNMVREKTRLVLCFDEKDRLTLAYKDVVYRYDDIRNNSLNICRQ